MFLENDTLARIGTSCLQQLLESNVTKLSSARWERVATTFVKLFRTTTPHQLFDESLRVEIDGNTAEVADPSGCILSRLPIENCSYLSRLQRSNHLTCSPFSK